MSYTKGDKVTATKGAQVIKGSVTFVGLSYTDIQDGENTHTIRAEQWIVKADVPPLPPEPGGYGTVIKFEGWLPVVRNDRNSWYFTNNPGRKRTWEELLKFVGGVKNSDYTVLYSGN